MAEPLLTGALWERVVPLLPPPPRPKNPSRPGRHRIDDRTALTGILFVLKTGISWDDLPAELGCGSGMTCRRRRVEWHRAGSWAKLRDLFLAELGYAGRIDWDRALEDRPPRPARRRRREADGHGPGDYPRNGAARNEAAHLNGAAGFGSPPAGTTRDPGRSAIEGVDRVIAAMGLARDEPVRVDH